MRAVGAALVVMVAILSSPVVAEARAHRKPAQDPFGELFAPQAKSAQRTKHRGLKVARHHRRHTQAKLVATLVPTAPRPVLVASNGPFVPEACAADRHALAGP
jgi:hypothetical protein